jgi:hypothetical protein
MMTAFDMQEQDESVSKFSGEGNLKRDHRRGVCWFITRAENIL